MEPTAGQPMIEFIDDDAASPPTPGDHSPERPRLLIGLVGLTAVCVALVLVGSAISGRDDAARQQPPEQLAEQGTTTTVQATTTTAARVIELASVDFTPWPSPPRDRDPTVISRPGPNEPVFGEATGTSVVYVNSLGRPTIISLDTGRIEEVDVAPARTYDYFGVEFGSVVSFDGRSRSISEATNRSLLFHAHRAGSSTKPEQYRASTRPSPHLCLTVEPCSDLAWSFDRATDGTDTVRRANVVDDPEVMEMLFGQSWTTERTSRLAPPGFSTELRIPAPLNDDVWIVHQPAVG